MNLETLSLVNFKNFSQVELELSPRINCFVGDNGVGKTNILDAIHYLCLCKSYFNPIDTQNITHDEEFSVIQGEFLLDGIKNEIYCSIQRNKNKVFKRNKKEYDRLAHHIGLLPVVMISPEDSVLITEGSDERRKFLNSVISQYDKVYLDDNIAYNKLLAQRNKFLKNIQGSWHYDRDMLEVYNEKLVVPGKRIHHTRTVFTKKLVPIFRSYYNKIAPDMEAVDLKYHSQLEQVDFLELLVQSVEKDIIMQYTTTGIHKDDIILKLNGHHMKKTASQGQQKTFLVSLKLAQFDFIREMNKVRPILLLDDVFDKFDESRVRQIIKIVTDSHFGQIFITHTDEQKMRSILDDMNTEFKIFNIAHKDITSI
ncbi:MAG: DNA replication and repair protein RecF [Bacteroidales bacterium]|nr:DNA replication and repair protein RecF [Bacteroidales bacterium]